MATAKKTKRVIEAEGVAHISATFNNTTITITDTHGNAVSWGSSGKAGFQGLQEVHAVRRDGRRGAGCSRSDDARCPARACARAGTGSGRESAIQALASAGLQVKSIKDVTPIPHNGCRPPKRRRV
jgi:small subunit ribosomal protein S11